MAGVNVRITASDQASANIKGIHGLIENLKAGAKQSLLTGFGLGGGVAAFNALSGAVRGAVDYIGDAIDAASNLAESQSKVNVVFGDSADEISAWADDSASAFGQSKQAALEAVGTYGNLFQAFGIGRTESAGMSKSLVELAADLASFNNTPVDDALQALRSGLSGETEPLKRFGIALTDARMRSVLAAQGVTDLGATLTASQKATAAYTIIMSDSALAQGDFARTSDGLANQQRIMAAELENVSAEIGDALLPIMVELAHFATESVIPVLHGIVQLAKDLGPALEALGDVFRGSFVAGAGALKEFKSQAEQLEHATAASGATTASNWIAMGEAMQAATADTTSYVEGEWLDMKDEVVKITGLIPSEVANAMIKGQEDVEAGVEVLTQLMNDEWTDASRIAYYQGILTSQQLADGLASGDADVRSQAIFVRDNAIRELERLQSGAYDAGANAGNSYGRGLGSPGAYGTVQNAAGALRLAAQNPLDFKGEAYGIGQNVGGYYGQGLASTTAYVFTVAQQLKLTAQHALEFAGSPPYSHAREIGTKVAEAWGEGLSRGLGDLPNLSGALPGGGFMSGAAATGGGFMGGGEIHTHIYLDGREIAEAVDRQHYYMQPTYGTLPRN